MPFDDESPRTTLKVVLHGLAISFLVFGFLCSPWPYRLMAPMMGWSGHSFFPDTFGAFASTGFFQTWSLVSAAAGAVLLVIVGLIPRDTEE